MRQPSHADLAAQLHSETQRFTERLTREEERLSAIQDKLDQLTEAEVIAAMERRMPIAKALVALLWLRIRWEKQV